MDGAPLSIVRAVVSSSSFFMLLIVLLRCLACLGCSAGLLLTYFLPFGEGLFGGDELELRIPRLTLPAVGCGFADEGSERGSTQGRHRQPEYDFGRTPSPVWL